MFVFLRSTREQFSAYDESRVETKLKWMITIFWQLEFDIKMLQKACRQNVKKNRAPTAASCQVLTADCQQLLKHIA